MIAGRLGGELRKIRDSPGIRFPANHAAVIRPSCSSFSQSRLIISNSTNSLSVPIRKGGPQSDRPDDT